MALNDPDGRYSNIPLRARAGPAGEPVAYLARRFVPDPATLTIAGVAVMEPGERIDMFSARVQGVSTAWWRVADARRIIHPDALEEPQLQRLQVPLPQAGR